MKKILFLLLLSTLYVNADWGKTGHRVVGEVAQNHLNANALAAVKEILDSKSLALVSNWPDEMRSNPDFDKYGPWHYVNLPLDKEYHEIERNLEGDVIQTIKKAIQVLKDDSSSKELKAFYLKYLVHTVGDIHQPMHTGRAEDYGGSKIPLTFKGRKGSGTETNLHVLWDTNMIDDYKMSYTEFANSLEEENIDGFQQGYEELWAYESHQYAKEIYATVNAGDFIGYDYLYHNFPIVKRRLYQAGVRLAGILNSIFSE